MTDDARSFALPPVPSHDDCNALAQFLAASGAAAGTHIDASAVHRCGALAAQLLVTGAEQARAGGHDFAIQAASDGFIASIRDLGLTEHLPIEGA